MSRFLLTGGGGFVGQWVARALLSRGHGVTLAGLGSWETAPRILDDDERARVQWLSIDIRAPLEVASMVDAARPDVVMHLAGVAFPPEGDREPTMMYEVNCLGVVRLLSVIAQRRKAGELDPTVLVIGSGQQYGAHDEAEMPLREEAEQRPVSVYAASKAAQEVAALQFFRAEGIRIVCTRSFNHSGVGHGSEYVLPSLVRRVIRLRETGGTALALGNDVVRDWLHVADVAEAYIALAERGKPGTVYNVSSGVGVTVRRLAEDVLLRAGVAADISTEPTLKRAADTPILTGSPERLMADTGWMPRRTQTDIIDDLVHAATR
jgi:GDP-4-dehydro-6-deoxy-D-mannose reductase